MFSWLVGKAVVHLLCRNENDERDLWRDVGLGNVAVTLVQRYELSQEAFSVTFCLPCIPKVKSLHEKT